MQKQLEPYYLTGQKHQNWYDSVAFTSENLGWPCTAVSFVWGYTKNVLNEIYAKATWTVLPDWSFSMGALQ